MGMKIDLQTAAQRLRENDNILILIHQFPDGDTIGCGFALCRALQSLSKTARVLCSHTVNQKYDYILNSVTPQCFEPDFVVSVDVADQKLLGEPVLSAYGSRIDLSIDHHGSNTFFAKENYVDASAAAASEILYELICLLCGEPDKQMAAALYTGISTDTGCFKFTNTTPKTHLIAAKLMERGIDYGEINRIMFDTKVKSRILLERMALDSMRFFCDDKVAIMPITREMKQKSGADDEDLNGISALPRQVEGVLIGITVREQEGGYCKISVRTHEPVSAAEFCAKFGGGGHVRAAGCEIKGSVEEASEQLLALAKTYFEAK